MKIIFMGTPDFAVPVLEALCQNHEVVAVYTRAPKESGRGKKLTKTPVHILAESKGIPVHTPKSLKGEDEQQIMRAYKADLGIVAAYGLLLPQAVLDMFPTGCINVHASLLPRWRGAAPIERSIEAGDKKSGISIMQMVAALDAGDVFSQKAVEITHTMTGGELKKKLSEVGAKLLIETLDKLHNITPQKQDENLVTYAHKIEKSESLIDFKIEAEKLLNKIRAFTPEHTMYFMHNNERFKIHEAEIYQGNGEAGQFLKTDKELVIATKDSAIKVTKIQREGKQPMPTADLLRGFKFASN